MLTVTEAAGGRLARLLDERHAPAHTAIRFLYQGLGITLQPDRERPGDTTFQHEGRTVLLLDAEVSGLLADETLSLVGMQLRLTPPAVRGSRPR